MRGWPGVYRDDAAYVRWHYGPEVKVHHPGVKGFVHVKDSIIRQEEPYPESGGTSSP